MTADFDLQAPLPEGTVLLEASAGTGKTFSIAHLAIRYVAERRVPIDELLVVTFTEAATRELSERIRARIRDAIDALDGREVGDDVLRSWAESSRNDPVEAAQRRLHLGLALANFDAASISTIHGFCKRVLSQAAFESSADEGAELLTDSSDFYRDVVFDYVANALTRLSADEYEMLGDVGTVKKLSSLVNELDRNPKARVLPAPGGKAEAFKAYEQALAGLRKEFRAGAAKLQAELERAIADDILKGDAKNKPELVLEAFRAIEARLSKDGALSEHERKLFGLLAGKSFLHKTKAKGRDDLNNDPILAAVDALVQADARLVLEVQLEFLHPLVREVRENVPVKKRKLGIVTFQDLLQLVEASVGVPDSPLVRLLRNRYKVALIDEFQDTDPVQWTIFRSVFHEGKKPLWLIGDPKQAIYSFRGADLEVYFQARDAAHFRFRLARNHRSDEPLVDAVNGLFTRQGAFRHPKLEYEAVRAANDARIEIGGKQPRPLRIHIGDSSRSKAPTIEWVKNEVLGFLQCGAEIVVKNDDGTLGKRKVTPRDCAVIVTTNWLAREVRDALREVGVPSVLHTDESVFATDEAAELGLFLRAIADHESTPRLLAFLATRIAGFDAREIDKVRSEEAECSEWKEKLEGWAKLFRQHGLMRAVRAMASELQVEQRLASLPGGERRLADFFHAAELLHAAQHEEGYDAEELALYLDRERADEKEKQRTDDEARKVRLETDADAVEIVTIHRSKGLEYPVVFCADLFDERDSDRFPLRYSKDGERILHLAPEFDAEAKALAEKDNLEESLRLAYVALTRARHFCCVLYRPGPKTSLRTSALDWLFFGHLDNKDRQKVSYEPINPLRELFADKSNIEVVSEGFAGEAPFRMDHPSLDLAAAEYRRKERLDELWRWASFSSIVGHRKTETIGDEKEDDEGDGDTDVTSTRSEAASPGIEAHLARLPLGRELGSLVHKVFETIDFGGPGDLLEQVRTLLPQYGLDKVRKDEPKDLDERIAAMIADTLATPIDVGGDQFRLAEVGKGDRQSEMRFTFPVERTSQRKIGEKFRAHGLDGIAEDIRALRGQDLVGLLHGSIDLVFRRGGRYYVADFKTNYLGDTLGDYEAAKLEETMREKRYHLQGYLYALALHRHLGRRLRGYDPEQHFGGIFFFFVRGMTPATGSRFGIHFDRPKAKLLQALDELFLKGDEAA